MHGSIHGSMYGGSLVCFQGSVHGSIQHPVLARWPPSLPRSFFIYVFMFVFLALGFFGVIDLLQLGSMANGAHLGGLLAGLLLGAAFALLERRNAKRSMR